MRLLVTGGRDYRNTQELTRALDQIHARVPIDVLIQGGARGADTLAKEWAERRGVRCVTEHANWELYGPRAGRVRNRKMLRDHQPHLVAAFPGGLGTMDMVNAAAEARVRVILAWIPEDVRSGLDHLLEELQDELSASSTGNH